MERTDVERPHLVNGNPVPPYFTKTSSSEWNSSDDLAGPLSEQEDSNAPPQVPSRTFSHAAAPPVPPKPHGPSSENRRHLPEDPCPSSPLRLPRNGSALSSSVLQKWLENSAESHTISSDTSSKSGSSDQERNDLSASEGEEKIKPETGSPVIPTTYFSVDHCMTDTYRAKYHKRRAPLYMTADSRAGDHTSSGESDYGDRVSPAPSDTQTSQHFRAVAVPVQASSKATAKWHPVSVRGLDEHGFL